MPLADRETADPGSLAATARWMRRRRSVSLMVNVTVYSFLRATADTAPHAPAGYREIPGSVETVSSGAAAHNSTCNA